MNEEENMKGVLFLNSKRLIFAIIWSLLSVIGIIGFFKCSGLTAIILYYFTGFHIPQNAIYFLVLFGAFSNHPEIAILCIVAFLVFIIFWLVSLIKLKNSKMFEKLIIFDRVASLLILVLVVLIQNNQFTGWYMFIVPVVENLIIMLYLLGKRKEHKGTVLTSFKPNNKQ